MQAKTDYHRGVYNGTAELEAAVRDAVEQGHAVQEVVRRLTVRAISAHSLDIATLRLIAAAVMRGARMGVHKELHRSAEHTEIIRARLTEAVTGLDEALAQFVEASRLALEEATGRAKQYSSEDLARVRADMEVLEAMFLDTLQRSASGGRDVAREILNDLASHRIISGTVVGAKLRETLAVIAQQSAQVGRTHAGTGLHLAEATSDLLRQIAAGVLSGLADHVKPDRRPAGKSD